MSGITSSLLSPAQKCLKNVCLTRAKVAFFPIIFFRNIKYSFIKKKRNHFYHTSDILSSESECFTNGGILHIVNTTAALKSSELLLKL